MRPKYLIALIGCAAAWLAMWFFTRTVKADPGELASRALTAKEVADRANATVELCALQDAEAARHMRRLAGESGDVQVLVPVLSGLAARYDSEAKKLCLDRLDHTAEAVREAAIQGLSRIVSIPVETLDFKSDAPPEVRRAAVEKLRKEHATPDDSVKIAMMKSTLPVEPAPAPLSVDSPVSAKKDMVKDSPKEPSVKDAPAPAPSVAPAPPPGAVVAQPSVAPPLPPPDNPAIQVLVWMCRALAVMMLLGELAGAVSLILGERTLPRSRAAEANAEPGEAGRLWSRITVLFAGAFCIVVLLIAAEMIPVAVRMEQRLEYLTRVR